MTSKKTVLKKINITNKDKIEKIINEVIRFSSEKQMYLNNLQVNEDEIKGFNITSEEFKLKLDLKSTNCKSFTFSNKLIRFDSNSTEKLIGSTDYKRLIPMVNKLSVYLYIIITRIKMFFLFRNY